MMYCRRLKAMEGSYTAATDRFYIDASSSSTIPCDHHADK
jgi:hypothetical protein